MGENVQTAELAPYIETDLSYGTAEQINAKIREHIKTLRKSVLLAYEIGQMLYGIQDRLDGTSFSHWCSQNLEVTPRTAYRYICVYNRYKDCPEQLKDKTQTEALIEAGLNGYGKKREGISGGEHSGDRTIRENLDFNIEQLFLFPCAGSSKLEKYRVASFPENGRVWVASKEGGAVPVAEMHIDRPQGMPDFEYKELFKNIQIAVEHYFERIEEYERKGII